MQRCVWMEHFTSTCSHQKEVVTASHSTSTLISTVMLNSSFSLRRSSSLLNCSFLLLFRGQGIAVLCVSVAMVPCFLVDFQLLTKPGNIGQPSLLDVTEQREKRRTQHDRFWMGTEHMPKDRVGMGFLGRSQPFLAKNGEHCKVSPVRS